MKYAWIRDHRDTYPVKVVRQLLDVSASGYYGATGRAPSRRSARHVRILDSLRRIHAESREILLDRDFTAPAENQKWAADIAYLRTDPGLVYVAVVNDPFSRKVAAGRSAIHSAAISSQHR